MKQPDAHARTKTSIHNQKQTLTKAEIKRDTKQAELAFQT